MLVFGTQIHIVTAVFIGLEILMFIFQLASYSYWPSDRNRGKYLLLLFLMLLYNITGGLFPDPKINIPINIQEMIAYGTGFLMASYFPYYFYKGFDLEELRWHALFGVPLFLMLPYLIFFVIVYAINGKLNVDIRYGMIVPFIYAIVLLWVMFIAIRHKHEVNRNKNEYIEEISMYCAVTPWLALALFGLVEESQLIEVLCTNTGIIIITVLFLRKSIRNARQEFNRKFRESAIDGISPEEFLASCLHYSLTGLPQINILLDRTKIANYGLNIEDVNTTISSAFAGKAAGAVFENERRFDLVIRLDTTFRTSIEDVGNLFISTPSGLQIPLSQIAKINLQDGPAQISREAGKRRIVISFNVLGRDVESVVKDIQAKLNQMKLPQGYYLTYGGAFENLQKASARLKIAVPLALFLIYLLLFFAFNSFKQATLVFTAIPMSAIGGVAALLIRGMPFSISAGVGFIALFGVAVLNGIVLIGTFNQLEKEGITDVLKRVLVGTSLRLRPVLMTATVASLGFLPMALSTGAGGEVQKPLATVVIGGLLTATFLTLIVLPLLYILFAKKTSALPGKPIIVTAVILLSLFGGNRAAYAQQIPVRSRIDTSMRNNLQLKVYQLQLNKSQTLIGTGGQLPKTGIFAENEDLRSGKNVDNPNGVLKIGISQALEWPGVYKARKNLLEEQSKYSQLTISKSRLEVRRDIRKVYYTIWYLQERQNLYKRLDSIYTTTYEAARLKVRVGDVAGLDSIAAETRLRELESQIQQFKSDIRIQQQSLKQLTGSDSISFSEQRPLEKLPVASYAPLIENHPQLQLQQQNVAIATAGLQLQKQSRYPDFEGRFFSQRLYGFQNPYSGFSVTARFPVFTKGYRTQVKAAEIEKDVQEQQLYLERLNLNTAYLQAVQKLERSKASLTFYETTGLKQANAIISAATLAYRSGEIGFAELSQFITQAIDIQRNYLDVLNDYNQAVIELNYYINQ